jgi:hypothetical protein
MNTQYQKSKSGLWHIIHINHNRADIPNLPICQSYNLDRPNYLIGEVVNELPEDAKLCRKCAAHLK